MVIIRFIILMMRPYVILPQRKNTLILTTQQETIPLYINKLVAVLQTQLGIFLVPMVRAIMQHHPGLLLPKED